MLKKAHQYLKKYFGYDSFRPGQEEIIESILSKKDTVGIMPTGGGKSICYQIPALCAENLVIVISPLISLMKDQIDSLLSKNYPARMLNSTVDYNEQTKIKKLVEENQVKLLYLTPERFRNSGFSEWINGIKISCFVIDEAHCISEWGHDFRPEYRKLSDIIKKLGNPPILALTATATPEVRLDIIKALQMNKPNVYVSGFNRENLIYGVQNHFTKEEKNKALINFINKVSSPGIVYTSSIKDAEMVHNILKTNINKKIGIYHGDLKSEIRKKMQDDFLGNKLDVLVATNAFGMGVNKTDIRFIAHYSIPGSIEAYYQETGRAGRDGKTSYCLLLALDEDERIQNFFIKAKNPSLDSLIEVLKVIKKKSKNNLLFTEDINALIENNILDNRKYNSFLINAILKQLHFMGCIDFDYKGQEEVEVNILNTKLNDMDKDFIEESFSVKINKERFLSQSMNYLTKRAGFSGKEIKAKLEELKINKFLDYKIIKSGQTIKLAMNEIPESIKKDYESKLSKKIEIDKSKFQAMVSYADLDTCRRKYLLNYFGEHFTSDNCTKCDICRGTYKKDLTVKWNDIQSKLMLFYAMHENKIGKTKSIKILKGSPDIEPRFSEWDEYGILKKHDITDIESEFYLLLKNKLIQIERGKYATVKLTHKGLKEFSSVFNKPSQ